MTPVVAEQLHPQTDADAMPWICPSCNSETELGVNICSNCRNPRPGSYGGDNVTANAISKRRRINGIAIESILDFAALMILFLGVAASIWMGMSGEPYSAALTTFGAFLHWLLFRSLAEIIRLLKRNGGFDYEGRVSGSSFDHILSCSHCGAALQSDASCDRCGARIVKPEADNQTEDDG
ncbi:hypothetical protein CGZ80_20295 [Rhodopirellula sp. MGV]|nr:hypothetical protein CGZ80_20295 [Rhodopirellula sp. MGV]PNY38007.1 hypothetical protein C2E31_04820 [Rhodopirellula baltica]